MKLSNDPELTELLVWCDYLTDSDCYPETAVAWLRQALLAGLKVWSPWGPETRKRFQNLFCWDAWNPAVSVDVAQPARGELPHSLWLHLRAGQLSHPPGHRDDSLCRRRYPTVDDAFQDLRQAVPRWLLAEARILVSSE
jgi:hypothetical protein